MIANFNKNLFDTMFSFKDKIFVLEIIRFGWSVITFGLLNLSEFQTSQLKQVCGYEQPTCSEWGMKCEPIM